PAVRAHGQTTAAARARRSLCASLAPESEADTRRAALSRPAMRAHGQTTAAPRASRSLLASLASRPRSDLVATFCHTVGPFGFRGVPPMRFLATVGIALLFLSVESVLTRELGMQVTRIDVTLVLVVFLGLRAATLEGAFASFVIGYLLDVFTGRPTGLYTFLAVLVFLLTRMLSSLVDARSRALFAIVCAGAALGHGLLAAFFSWLTSRSGGGTMASLAGLPLEVTLCSVAAAVMWPLLRRLDPGTERPQAGALR